MKYMLTMRASDEASEAIQDVSFDQIIEGMGRFNQEMISAGVLVAAEGLDEASQGVGVDYSSQPPVVTDWRGSSTDSRPTSPRSTDCSRCWSSPRRGSRTHRS